MKKLSIYLIALLILPAFLMTSCKDKEDPIVPDPDPAFTVLADYLIASDMDLPNIIKYHGDNGDIKFVTGPPADDGQALTDFLAKYTIFDIREASAFDAGHIDGATNVALGDILTAADGAANQVLVVCYTGQTACFAVSLLRLAGHSNAQSLKWGMSGWNTFFSDPWNNNIGNIGETDLVTTATASLTFDDPVLTETIEDGAALLDARIDAVLADGFKGVDAADVLATPTNYFINNYFSEADYTNFGHIDGAYRILPLTLTDGEYSNLDPDAQVVTYCYTGQTSAVITAYLRVLGYDAYSLKFGMNGIWNLNPAWTTNQWGGDSNPKALPYVVTK